MWQLVFMAIERFFNNAGKVQIENDAQLMKFRRVRATNRHCRMTNKATVRLYTSIREKGYMFLFV